MRPAEFVACTRSRGVQPNYIHARRFRGHCQHSAACMLPFWAGPHAQIICSVLRKVGQIVRGAYPASGAEAGLPAQSWQKVAETRCCQGELFAGKTSGTCRRLALLLPSVLSHRLQARGCPLSGACPQESLGGLGLHPGSQSARPGGRYPLGTSPATTAPVHRHN